MNNESYKKSRAMGLILMLVLLSMFPVIRAIDGDLGINDPPFVDITRPREGYVYIDDKEKEFILGLEAIPIIYGKITFRVSADSQITGGYIDRVEFLIDGAPKGQCKNENGDPHKTEFSITFFNDDIERGRHTVEAIAYDNYDTAKSDSINIHKCVNIKFLEVLLYVVTELGEITFAIETGESITMMDTSFVMESGESMTMIEILSDGYIDVDEYEIILSNSINSNNSPTS